MVKIFKIIGILLFVYLPACTASDNKTNQLKMTDITTTSAGSDEKSSFCQKFNLTNKQANEFFTKSHLISTKTMHDMYDYLPCYVRGKSKLDETNCNWEIRAGGTAEVSCNNQNFIVACDLCDNLLQDSE